MMRHFLILSLAFFLVACGNSTVEAPDPEATTTPPPAPASTEPPTAPVDAPASSPSKLSASVQVVDLSGVALANMAPIVTRSPNAFDAPVATGSATDGGGNGTITFPSDERLYLRAWDPALNYFPNNFYEVLPGGASLEERLTIQMVPASSLSVQFLLPGDAIAANTTVGVMLLHPTRGPWWPAEGVTDGDGFVRFPHLPAGEFVLRFKAESGPRLEHGQTALPPGDRVDLGVLTLQ